MSKPVFLRPRVLASISGIILAVVGCTTTVNQAPIADAGSDSTAAGGTTIVLDGSGSFDPEGGVLTFQWTQTAGPVVTLQDADSSSASFRAPNSTNALRFQLTVTDADAATGSDSVTVNVELAENVPPNADAGADQSVRGGDVVQLNGEASRDDDGDALTFAWVQSDGTDVALEDEGTATPTFTAPNTDEELVFQLTVSDGNGHSEEDTVTISVLREAGILFVANLGGDSVLRFVDASDKTGNVAPDTVLVGTEASLDDPSDVIVTRESWLIASNRASNSLNLYLQSAFASGSLEPFFVVQGDATLLDRPTGLEYASADDLVFVSTTGSTSRILVFEGPSKVIFDGNLAPFHVISSSDLDLPAGLALDAEGRLYVANTGAREVLAFDSALSADGNVPPSRVITSAAFTDPVSVDIDVNDNLYVVNSTGTILVFENASTRTGAVEPDATVTVSGAGTLASIEVAADGTAFLLDSASSAIYVIHDLATRTGTVTPHGVITGSQTGLSGPFGLFLLEG